MSDFIVSVISLMIVVAVANWVLGASCTAQWAPSGYATSYGLIQGCLVKQDGKFVPADNVRVIVK